MLKFYTKEVLKVLHEYKIRGIYYPNEENMDENSGRVGMIHIIEYEEAAAPPLEVRYFFRDFSNIFGIFLVFKFHKTWGLLLVYS